eukprot:1882113-Rhodomonas_salina.1
MKAAQVRFSAQRLPFCSDFSGDADSRVENSFPPSLLLPSLEQDSDAFSFALHALKEQGDSDRSAMLADFYVFQRNQTRQNAFPVQFFDEECVLLVLDFAAARQSMRRIRGA